jgi:hypothetical protein
LQKKIKQAENIFSLSYFKIFILPEVVDRKDIDKNRSCNISLLCLSCISKLLSFELCYVKKLNLPKEKPSLARLESEAAAKKLTADIDKG